MNNKVIALFLVGIVAIFGCGCIEEPTPVLVTPIPTPEPVDVSLEGYYESGCQLPADMTMHEYLIMEWETPYEEDGWDCSQMSAYTEWFVENCGYDAVILVSTGHGWVSIDIDRDGTFYQYEATGCFWITPEDIEADEDMYTVQREYEDIYEIHERYNEAQFEEEWGWWM